MLFVVLLFLLFFPFIAPYSGLLQLLEPQAGFFQCNDIFVCVLGLYLGRPGSFIVALLMCLEVVVSSSVFAHFKPPRR